MTDPGRTYSEWNAIGCRVHRGQKAVDFKDGEAVFLPHQVYDPKIIEFSAKYEDYLVRAEEWEEMPY